LIRVAILILHQIFCRNQTHLHTPSLSKAATATIYALKKRPGMLTNSFESPADPKAEFNLDMEFIEKSSCA